MQFDLDRDERGVGFKFFESRVTEDGNIVYDDPKPDAAMFYIRPIGPKLEELQAKRKRKFDYALNPKTRAMERVGYFDPPSPDQAKQENDDIWDYAITGWDEKALDGKRQPIAVTRENKLKLMALPVFDRFVGRCLQILASAGVQDREAAEKNLPTG